MRSDQLWIFLILSIGLVCNSVYTQQCRDPDMGGQLGNRFSNPNSTGDLRKFLVVFLRTYLRIYIYTYTYTYICTNVKNVFLNIRICKDQ